MSYTKTELGVDIATSNGNNTDPLLHSDAVSHLLYRLINGGITSSPVDLSNLEALTQQSIDNQNDLEALITTLNATATALDQTVTSIDTNTDDLEALTTTLNVLTTQINTLLDSIEAKLDVTNTGIATVNTNLNALETLSNDIKSGVDGIEPLLTTSNTNLTSIISSIGTLQTSLNGFALQYDDLIANTDNLEAQLTTVLTSLSTINTNIGVVNTNLGGKLDQIVTNTADLEAKLDNVLTNQGTINTSLGVINTSIGSGNTILGNLLTRLNVLIENINPTNIISGTATITDANQTWLLPIDLNDWSNGYEITISLVTTGLAAGNSVTLESICSVNNGTTFFNATCDDSTTVINTNTAATPNARAIGLTYESSTIDTVGLDVVGSVGIAYSIDVAYKLYKK